MTMTENDTRPFVPTNDTRPFVPTEDREIVELPDGRALRLLIECDEDTTINDYDCYGRVAWVGRDRYTGLPSNRPDDFDGRARKLWTRSDAFWWQPPADVADADLLAMSRHVADLMEYGFHVYVVELLGEEDDADFYGRRPVLDVLGALGGVDTTDSAYVQEIVGGIVAEGLEDAEDLVRW